jgi:ketosteroid isomerase-like protein
MVFGILKKSIELSNNKIKIMKTFQAFTLPFMMLFFIGCQESQKESTDNTDIETTKALIKEFTQVLNSSDTTKFAAFFPTYLEESVEFMPPNEPRIVGNQVHDFFMGYARQFSLNITFSNEEFFSGGDWAFHRYTYNLIATPKSGGEPFTELGNGIHIFHRQVNGSWKLAKDVWSVPPK